LGHAGAIVEGGTGTAKIKVKALENAGVRGVDVPWEVGKCIKEFFLKHSIFTYFLFFHFIMEF